MGGICKQYAYGISEYKFPKMIDNCFTQGFTFSIHPFVR